LQTIVYVVCAVRRNSD